MTGSGQQAERDRLHHVYADYDQANGRSQHWSRDNVGNSLIHAERDRWFQTFLNDVTGRGRSQHRILEIGCGEGRVMDSLQRFGIDATALHGMDLLAWRLHRARSRHPSRMLTCADAARLPFRDGSFSDVVVSTVFSSILDDSMVAGISREVRRVLGREGRVLWYDLRFDNPWNRNVRAMTGARIRQLFPDFRMQLRTVTVLPPLTRHLGSSAKWLYPLLSRIPFLRTHNIGILTRQIQ